MDDASPPLYPNAESDRADRVARRRFLTDSAAVGAAVSAVPLGVDAAEEPAVEARPTVFVFNTGDGTVTLVDAERNEAVGTAPLGMTSSFPSNQFTPALADAPGEPLWANVDDGVRALAAGSLSELAHVETGSGANWQERTPDGAALVVSAREPAHRQLRLDADPASDGFGEVTAEIDRRSEDGRGDAEGPGPCDVTIHPDGEYAYVPDLFGDTLTVLDVQAFEVERQVEVEAVDGTQPEPWMGTAAWDGETLLVENSGGRAGSESVWDVSDPADPVEAVRLTPDEGLGEGPLTSEVGPESAFGYVFTPGSEDVTVVDIEAGRVEARLDLGGSAFVGTWGPDRESLYVPVQTADEVAVIDADSREIATRIAVGPEPYGATAAGVRPAAVDGASLEALRARLDALTGAYDTSYCIGECACGHRL